MEEKKKSLQKPAPKRQRHPATPKALELLVTVVNRNKTEFFMDFLQQYEVNMQMSVHAKGTAGGDLLRFAEWQESERQVIFGFIREDRVKDALAGLEEKFATVRGGKGIAYTVPLSSVSGVAIYRFLSNFTNTPKEKKGEEET